MLKLLSFLPKPWTRRLIHGRGLLANPYTLGVRVIVEDAEQRFLLVRHNYLSGWYLPGGGVDRGETLLQAAVRELREEAGIMADRDPSLLSVYLNDAGTFGRDHVGLFHLKEWSRSDRFLEPSSEIREAQFFSYDDLPVETSPATCLRLIEFRESRIPAGARWAPTGMMSD